MLKHNKNKEVYDRMRARRARFMKRKSGVSRDGRSFTIGTHTTEAAEATGEAGDGGRGDPSIWIYLALLVVFLVILFGGMIGDGPNS